VPGPDRILERLDTFAAIRSVPRLAAPGEDLRRLLGTWNLAGGNWQRVWSVTPAPPEEAGAVKASLHLARLWAHGEVIRLKKARQVREAIALATRYQLVTPASGAVVLENQRQFADNNLTPVDPATVPSIPEPATAGLLLLGLIRLCLRKRLGSRLRQRGAGGRAA